MGSVGAEPPTERAGPSREEEVLRARRDSMERLGSKAFALGLRGALGVDEPVATSAVRSRFADLPPDRRTEDRLTVAGRVVLRRDMGKLRFLTLRDGAGDLQLVCDRSILDAEAFAALDEIDLGDIVGATGPVGTTRRGELSIFVDRWAMLTKSLRPLPEKWHGLKDPDLQQRRRYLHLIADEAPRRYARARGAVLRTLRAELDGRGFLEVEGPILQPVAGGANAKPFTTYHEALDVEMKLRISLELYLKRMLVGGFERVYELGRNFRNEGIDRDHNPEFTMLEAYQAYGDYTTMMELSEVLVRSAARAVAPILGRDDGDLTLTSRGRPIDLGPPFRRATMLELVSSATGEELTLDRPDLRAVAERHGVPVDDLWGPGKVVQELFETLVEDSIVEPTFVCDFPREVSPLARPHRDDPRLTEHFDLVIAGIELVTAFSELTDPIEQRAKFELQQRLKAAGVEETHPLDEGFLRALEHGMPPAGGLGLGIDRLLMLLTDAPSLRDLIMFPSLRPEADR
ncbi:MAG TPA: lysine--tRNA ligase [Actinomycetota bacterium]|nr:lysine--tRNA ligase [Actinomycetota bacterium]